LEQLILPAVCMDLRFMKHGQKVDRSLFSSILNIPGEVKKCKQT